MKRCFKWLINWFTKLEKEDRIGYVIGGIISIILAISIFATIDKVPATPSDYEPMEKQAMAIQKDPDLLFSTNCNIYINDEVITVDFENYECKLTAQYDKNFELLSISKYDNYTFWLFALGEALSIGVFSYGVLSFMIMIVIICIESLWEFVCNKFKVHKSNSKKDKFIKYR